MGSSAGQFVPTRRSQRRVGTIAEIKQAALTHVRHGGAAAVSLRAVARDLGMSGPGLYRYYNSRDDLITALVADAADDLGATLELARDDAGPDPRDGLTAVSRAYRQWAKEHVAEFGLIFDAPLPGFAAPPEGPTVQATRRYGRVVVGLIADAWHQAHGARALTPPTPVPDLVTGGPVFTELGIAADPALVLAVCTFWSRMHGLVTLDVYGHLVQAGVPAETIDALYDRELATLLSGLSGTS